LICTKKKPSEEAKRIPAFGFGNGNEVEIYVIKPYVSGFDYYSPIDYSGSLPYALLEENIADYQINDCQNGFSGTKVINFNNGIPSEEMRDKMKRDVLGKLTGARGEKVIVAFNSNAESKTTVEDLPLNDAPAHYEYLSRECFEKLIVGHRVTSPMLLGIRTGDGGLGNNADEIKTATLLFDNIVIKPYQLEIIEALDAILAINNISLKLYFKTIQPLEFVDTSGMNAETQEEETGVKMSADTNVELDDFLSSKGEILSDNWVCVDETEVDYDTEEELDSEINNLNKKSILSKIVKFATSVSSRPNAKSSQDETIDSFKFITRYSYTGNQNPEREFCKKMMTASNNGKDYRKEDRVKKSVDKSFNSNLGKIENEPPSQSFTSEESMDEAMERMGIKVVSPELKPTNKLQNSEKSGILDVEKQVSRLYEENKLAIMMSRAMKGESVDESKVKKDIIESMVAYANKQGIDKLINYLKTCI